MSKVYILLEGQFSVHDATISQIVGATKQESVANEWYNISSDPKDNHFFRAVELDDPELLNRIAKEGK